MLPVMPLAFEGFFSSQSSSPRPPPPRFGMLNMLVSKSKQCDGTSFFQKCSCIKITWLTKLRAPPPKTDGQLLSVAGASYYQARGKYEGESLFSLSDTSLRFLPSSYRHLRLDTTG